MHPRPPTSEWPLAGPPSPGSVRPEVTGRSRSRSLRGRAGRLFEKRRPLLESRRPPRRPSRPPDAVGAARSDDDIDRRGAGKLRELNVRRGANAPIVGK